MASLNIGSRTYTVINVTKTPGDSKVGIGPNPGGFTAQDFFSKRGICNMQDLDGICMDYDSIQKKFFESIQENGIIAPEFYEDESGVYLLGEAMEIASAREFGEKGTTTGKPRILSFFDAVQHADVIKNDPNLVINAVDRGDKQDYVGITVAYIYFNQDSNKALDDNGKKYHNGDLIRIGDEFPDANILQHCHPIIKVLPSWTEAINYEEREIGSQLPDKLNRYISEIEKLTNANVIGIGNGPETPNMIWIKRHYDRITRIAV